ncbi:AMP-binding protein [Micromonospora chersina]|uniref:AMP-binding protein n=1 Tax=Micromonospora chersina TaxID=47854 RepID=UPI003722985F
MADVSTGELFNAAVAGPPDAILHTTDDGDALDRGTLTMRAEDLAQELRAGSVVAVCCDTDSEQIAAMLAVWRAGAVCLPLDVRHPRARLEKLVQEAGAAAVVGADLSPARRPARRGGMAAVVRLGGAFEWIPEEKLLERLAWMRDLDLVRPGDRVLRMSGPALDAGLWERAWPLAAGTCGVAAAPSRHTDLDHLTGLIEDQQISVVQCEPSWFHRLATQEWTGSLRSLRLVLCHAGTPQAEDLARFRERVADVTMLTGRGTPLPTGYHENPAPDGARLAVRGFSVDPVEVERAIMEHPAVASVIVETGADRLTARLTPVPGKGIGPRELRAFLRRVLPEQMIPTELAVVAETATAGPFVAPRDPEEQRLAEIWAEVLHRPRVGVKDNFFDLGGDSVRAIQMVNRARAAGFDIVSAHVFEHQTVAALVRACGRRVADETSGSSPAAGIDQSTLDLIQRRFGASFGGRP